VTRTTKLLLAAALVGGALAAYWFLALAPKRDQVTKLDAQISTKRAEVQQAETTARKYEATRKAYAANYATVVRLGKAVPAEDDVRSLVVQLDASAKRSKIDFSALNVSTGSSGTTTTAATGGTADASSTVPPGATAVGSAGFLAMPFSFTFEGSFFRLSEFFNQLDRFVQVNGDAIDVTGRLLRIESFSLSPQSDSSSLRAEIGATSYSLPSDEGMTAGATAQGPAGAAGTAAAGTTPASGTTPPTTTANAGVTG